jgi:hypothetical protein
MVENTGGIKMGGYSFGRGVPTWNGIPMIGAFQKDFSGSTYFVDNNSGSDGNKGDSWEKPFKTLAKAIAISNIDIAGSASRWARRNTIFYAADTETASLVAFPNKCDVVGVGSYDANKMPGITGRHAPVNTGNYGTRFFNVWFKATAAAYPIVTLASTSSGIEFHDCTFDGSAGTVTLAINAVASPFLKVVGCNIFGGFATGYILLGTGESAGTVIEGNTMTGSSGYGVANVTGTTSSYASFVNRNTIVCATTGICIDDEANSSTGIWYTVGNRCNNQATLSNFAGRTGIVDLNETRAIDNICSGADIAVQVPKLVVA